MNTKKHQSVKETAETEIKRLKFLLSSSPAVTYTCEAFGDFADTFISGNITKLLGYLPSDFLDNPGFWADQIHPDDKECILNGLEILFEKDYHVHEYRFRHKDGSYVWMHDELRLIRDADGKPFEMVGSWLVITSRKQSELALEESEERYRTFVQDFQGIAYREKTDFTPVFLHGAIEKITGYSEKDFTSRNLTWDEIIFPDDLPQAMEDSKKMCTIPNYSYQREYRITRKDGQIAWVDEIAHNVCDKSGIPQFVDGTIYDITDHKQEAEEKASLMSQLRQAHKMEAIGTLTGGIAHDFNNILAIILGNAELAKITTSEDHPAKHNIDQVISASNRAKELVKRLLIFTRIEKGKKEPFYLCRLIDESMETIRSITPKSVKLEVNIPSKCRENIDDCLMIHADSTQINQLFMNLCANAVQAMDEEGTLEVSLDEVTFKDDIPANRSGVKPGTYEYLSVSDSGHGVNPELIDKIFDPFFTTKDVGKGTGMGLSVVQGIIKNHGGYIFVESEPEQGTTFHMYFPVTYKTKPETKFDEDTPLPTGEERILYVDDEEMLADVGKSIIEGLGYSVSTHTDSSEALEIFKNNPSRFDLVITDQAMPNITGSELAKQLLQVRPDIPIILCTGYSSKVNKEEARQIGIKKFAFKPMDIREIAILIRQVLDEVV